MTTAVWILLGVVVWCAVAVVVGLAVGLMLAARDYADGEAREWAELQAAHREGAGDRWLS